MPWLEAAMPVRMERVALVAPAASLRQILVEVADAGAVEIDQGGTEAETPSLPARLLRAAGREREAPALSAVTPDPAELARAGRYDLLAGEAQLEAHADAALRRSGATGLAGWMPADRLPEVTGRIAALGGALVPLPHPPGAQAPTMLGGPPLRRALMPLVRTYGTVPYADIDPSWLAWFSYVLMFGMMFGDAGQGILLVVAAVALRAGWPAWARRYRPAWPFVGGAGVSATLFGFLYGEFFGPTGVVPTLWLNPLDEPIQLLLAALALGTVMLAGAYALGAINRWREGGWPIALYAPSGAAGISLFLGIGVAAGGWYFHHDALLAVGAAIAAVGLILAFIGFFAESGGKGAGVFEALVELFDLVVRLGSNLFSFARLAAFGLMHAALGLVVWEAATALWHKGGAMMVAAVVVFTVGMAVTFSLEALVAAVQALRLEYYELFSRVFQLQGWEFRPWYVPTSSDPVPGGAAPGPGQAG
jgi:V/A-type H+-transporting ATPase subunit I